jgi:hypothetical protein
VFEDDLITLTTAGASTVVGTADRSGAPRATRGWAILTTGDRRVRVTMSADDPTSVANLDGGMIAITVCDVRTLRARQLKGRVVSTGAPTPADLDLVEEQTAVFFRAVHETDGNPLEMLERFRPATMLTVDVEVTDVFDQTPGPIAGSVVEAPS